MRVGILILVWLGMCCDPGAKANDTGPDLKLLRKQLMMAINSSHTTDSLYTDLDHLNNKTPLIVAYMGALDALKAKHSWNPYSKIKSLSQASQLMQKAIDNDPHNIEIRFMRFSVQHNVPAWLGYSKNLDADRDEILQQLGLKNYGTADVELTHSIIRFSIDSKRCSSSQNVKLRQYLIQIK